MKKIVTYSLIFLFGSCFSSCISEFNASLPLEDSEVLVVSGTILGGDTASFYVAKTLPLETKDKETPGEVNVKLVVKGDNGYISDIAERRGNYHFVYIPPLEDEVAYNIEITTTSGEVYRSEAQKPLITPPIDSLSFQQSGRNLPVSFHVSAQGVDDNRYFSWNYEEIWEVQAYFHTNYFYDPDIGFYKGEPNTYCWRKNTAHKILVGSTETLTENTLIDHELFQEEATHNKFIHSYRLVVTQKSISRDSYVYNKNRITLNDEMGGLFTPQPSEVRGNIECITSPLLKTIGFVDVVKNTTSDTIFVRPGDIDRYAPSTCEFLSSEELGKMLEDMGLIGSSELFYYMGYRPIAEPPSYDPVYWSQARCTDCVAAGGSLEKPADWPH